MSKTYIVVREGDDLDRREELVFVAYDLAIAEAKLEELETIEDTKEVAHYDLQNAFRSAGCYNYLSSEQREEMRQKRSVKYGVEAPNATDKSVYVKAEYWIDEVEGG